MTNSSEHSERSDALAAAILAEVTHDHPSFTADVAIPAVEDRSSPLAIARLANAEVARMSPSPHPELRPLIHQAWMAWLSANDARTEYGRQRDLKFHLQALLQLPDQNLREQLLTAQWPKANETVRDVFRDLVASHEQGQELAALLPHLPLNADTSFPPALTKSEPALAPPANPIAVGGSHEQNDQSRRRARWLRPSLIAITIAVMVLIGVWPEPPQPYRLDSGAELISLKRVMGHGTESVSYGDQVNVSIPPSSFAFRWLILIDHSGPWQVTRSAAEERDRPLTESWSVNDSPFHFVLVVFSDHDLTDTLQSNTWFSPQDAQKLQQLAQKDPTLDQSFAVVSAALRRAKVANKTAFDLRRIALKQPQ